MVGDGCGLRGKAGCGGLSKCGEREKDTGRGGKRVVSVEGRQREEEGIGIMVKPCPLVPG